jgi:cysteine synthase B
MTQSPQLQLQMTQPEGRSPWVIWGGLLPSGSLKYLTFECYFSAISSDALACGLIEISEGCTALALQHFAQRFRVPLVVVCSPAGRAKLHGLGYHGDTLVARGLEEALQICASRQTEGWHWPEQMSNAKLVSAVQAWAPEVARLLRSRPEVDTVACGLGTGATLTGLELSLTPLGYRVVGVESPRETSISGWRNYSLQNLGE